MLNCPTGSYCLLNHVYLIQGPVSKSTQPNVSESRGMQGMASIYYQDLKLNSKLHLYTEVPFDHVWKGTKLRGNRCIFVFTRGIYQVLY